MIKLNNPGNIRISDTPWQGKVAPSRDEAFETFDTPEHGLRAMAKILLTYFERGLNTIELIIPTWAPPSENNTDAYIDDVCDRSGFDSDRILEAGATTLCSLVSAIVWHENGRNPYTDQQIAAGVALAMHET